MLLENNTKNVINLIKMCDDLCNEKKLILLIQLFECFEFKTNCGRKNIIDVLKNILNDLNQDYNKTIINFSKYK